MRMSAPLSRGALLVVLAALFVPVFLSGAATAATPIEGSIGPANASNTAWDFAAVGPGVSLGGTTETTGVCAPVYCDAYQLTVALPDADQQFYLTHKATLTIDNNRTSAGPDKMDAFAFVPAGTERGPGSPDHKSTLAAEHDLYIANQSPGVWTSAPY